MNTRTLPIILLTMVLGLAACQDDDAEATETEETGETGEVEN